MQNIIKKTVNLNSNKKQQVY